MHRAPEVLLKHWSTLRGCVANISHERNLHIPENNVRVPRARPQGATYGRVHLRHDDEGPSTVLTGPRAFGAPLPRSGPTPARHC